MFRQIGNLLDVLAFYIEIIVLFSGMKSKQGLAAIMEDYGKITDI